ncbi:RDD family protein [Pedobacter sp. HDW13]|uniref:RDD family protein n=1 Tax=unclassified Pedobacter TaxID=2628915 RepID=UPI000F5B2057|nr:MULTISPECIES: RDD family protein [unclassified Pedobacter]QIL39689.1 RDD family protein [Pedobacter sp. HDW13]RQO79831.1 RDD family protein [Pedobacter sp. KBW01]
MDSIRISTAQNIDISYEIAGLGERIAARCIDLGVFLVLGIITLILMGASETSMSGGGKIILIVFLAIFVFYDLVCELIMDGQSLGKKVLKIKVISLDGGQPALSQYILRWLFRTIDFGIPLGWGVVALISVIVTKNHQRLGDILGKTTLIKTNPRTQFTNMAFSFSLPETYEARFKDVLHLNDREIELIHEVLTSYYQTGNAELIYAMAAKTKEHIVVSIPAGMNELQFLETVLKDYKHLTSMVNV